MYFRLVLSHCEMMSKKGRWNRAFKQVKSDSRLPDKIPKRFLFSQLGKTI